MLSSDEVIRGAILGHPHEDDVKPGGRYARFGWHRERLHTAFISPPYHAPRSIGDGRNRLTRRSRTIWLGAAMALLLVIIAAPAQASPVSAKKARLREVQAKLDIVGVQVSKAVEGYNQAASRLQATEARITENQRLLQAATRKLDLANQQLTARARDLYKTPSSGIVDAVFSARSFDDLVAQFDLMQRLGNSDVDMVRAVAAYERDVKDRRIALRADAKVATKLVDKRASEKTRIVALESQLRAESQGLQADLKRLQQQQQQQRRRPVAAETALRCRPSTQVAPATPRSSPSRSATSASLTCGAAPARARGSTARAWSCTSTRRSASSSLTGRPTSSTGAHRCP
jgi:peptidoglycan hydrolase CwlO-like protein